jgi:hypothetical protein
LLQALAQRDDPYRWLLYARRRWDVPLDERFSGRRVAARDPWWHLRANDACNVFLGRVHGRWSCSHEART